MFDEELIRALLGGFVLNLEVLAVAFPCAYGLGFAMLAGLGKLGPFSRQVLATFLLALRIIPVPVLLVVLYFPPAAYGVPLPKFAVAVIVFSGHYGAFFCEKFRSAYLAVGESHRDAAFGIGLSRYRTLRHVVVPQLALAAYPATTNAFLSMVKDSAVLSIIALHDSIQIAKNTYQATFEAFWPFTLVAAIFVAFYVLTSAAFHLLARALGPRFGTSHG